MRTIDISEYSIGKVYRQLGDLILRPGPVGRSASWGKCQYYTIFQNWVCRAKLNFVPQLALPPTDTTPNCNFPNWHFLQFFFCTIENLSPPTAGTPIGNTLWLWLPLKKENFSIFNLKYVIFIQNFISRKIVKKEKFNLNRCRKHQNLKNHPNFLTVYWIKYSANGFLKG